MVNWIFVRRQDCISATSARLLSVLGLPATARYASLLPGRFLAPYRCGVAKNSTYTWTKYSFFFRVCGKRSSWSESICRTSQPGTRRRFTHGARYMHRFIQHLPSDSFMFLTSQFYMLRFSTGAFPGARRQGDRRELGFDQVHRQQLWRPRTASSSKASEHVWLGEKLKELLIPEKC